MHARYRNERLFASLKFPHSGNASGVQLTAFRDFGGRNVAGGTLLDVRAGARWVRRGRGASGGDRRGLDPGRWAAALSLKAQRALRRVCRVGRVSSAQCLSMTTNRPRRRHQDLREVEREAVDLDCHPVPGGWLPPPTDDGPAGAGLLALLDPSPLDPRTKPAISRRPSTHGPAAVSARGWLDPARGDQSRFVGCPRPARGSGARVPTVSRLEAGEAPSCCSGMR